MRRGFVIFLFALCLILISTADGVFADGVSLTVTVDNPAKPPPSSGGGGAGPSGYEPASVIFSGLAYPKSAVTILRDGNFSASVIAAADGGFRIKLDGLFPATYLFSLSAQDASGRLSRSFSVPLVLQAGVITNVSGIFFSPTIEVIPTVLLPGYLMLIFGQSAPGASLDFVIAASSTPSSTAADKLGYYRYILTSKGLPLGDYTAKAKASLPAVGESDWSLAFPFRLLSKLPPQVLPAKCPAADLNGDCRVNLADLSVIMYWFGRTRPPKAVDLNADGKIDLVDMSIAAYYWTG